MTSAFTLVEMLIAVAVIALLAAASLPVYRSLRARQDRASTAALVQAVATAISTYGTGTWTVLIDEDDDDRDEDGVRDGTALAATAPVPHHGHLWDLNPGAGALAGDGVIDGRPAERADELHDGPFDRSLIASGYAGLLAMTSPPLSKRQVNARNQPIDAWRRPLRIAWAATIYGAEGFGVWSTGPDGVDGTDDDLRSWESAP